MCLVKEVCLTSPEKKAAPPCTAPADSVIFSAVSLQIHFYHYIPRTRGSQGDQGKQQRITQSPAKPDIAENSPSNNVAQFEGLIKSPKRMAQSNENKKAKRHQAGETTVAIAHCDVSVHPIASREGLIIQIVPPHQPIDDHLDRTPCDIVLVIDVSGSMSKPALEPPTTKGVTPEQTGLTVLDLTKHAAKMIIEIMNFTETMMLCPPLSMR